MELPENNLLWLLLQFYSILFTFHFDTNWALNFWSQISFSSVFFLRVEFLVWIVKFEFQISQPQTSTKYPQLSASLNSHHFNTQFRDERERTGSFSGIERQPPRKGSPWLLQRQTSYSEVDTRSRRRNSFVPSTLPFLSGGGAGFDYFKRDRLRSAMPRLGQFDSVKETAHDSIQVISSSCCFLLKHEY